MRIITNLVWYIILAAGTVRAFTLVRDARNLAQPITQARQAAEAFGIAGLLFWFFFLKSEVDHGFVLTNPSIMGFLGLFGTAVIVGVLVLVPMWLPRLLLRADRPSVLGKTLIVFIGRLVMVFAALCILYAPMASLFSDSLLEFVGEILSVAVPLGVLIMVSNTMVMLSRRV